jgi:MFS family permease
MGYDGSLMNSLNILPAYNDFFQLDTSRTALSTASTWIGNLVVGIAFAKVPDWIGRKPSMLLASLITIVGVVLGTAAQGFAMFVVSRILVGIGAGFSSMAGPIYFAETLPIKWRGIALCLIYDFWFVSQPIHIQIFTETDWHRYVGGLVASGVTYGTSGMTSTWSWRIPNLLQGFFSIVLLLLLPFLPESPRWLASVNRRDECRKVLAQIYSNGEIDNSTVQAEYQLITDSLDRSVEFESVWKVLRDMVKKPSDRKRTLLMLSVAVFSMWSGNNIVSYYLGDMLDQAGITDSTTQLQIVSIAPFLIRDFY